MTGYTGPGGSISIPTSFQGCPVTRIESTAFKGCNSITAVTIPDCVTNFGSSAFQD
ncbi:MAG: leucine-rich repeat protein [Lentisphaerae bacterium]|nr:leucine-rich repeat protein [Lentisphaerota bacterium]